MFFFILFFFSSFLFSNNLPECSFYIKNSGQVQEEILYYADFQNFRFYIRKNDLVFQFIEPVEDLDKKEIKIKNLYLKFEGGNLKNVYPLNKRRGNFNFFLGKNKFIKNVPVYEKILIKDIYDEVDLIFDKNFWHFETKLKNFKKPKIIIDSSLRIKYYEKFFEVLTDFGNFKIKYPETEARVNKSEEEGQKILWGTYLGGVGYDSINSLKVDSKGNILVAGSTFLSSVPVPEGYDQTTNGFYDGYVAKISADGNEVIWGTYVGGIGFDSIYKLEIDYMDNILVGGYTSSQDFPIINGFDNSYNGGETDGFIAKISPEGSDLVLSTYFGGNNFDYILALKLSCNGNILVAGSTGSEDFSFKNGFDSTFNGGYSDGFLAKISSEGNKLLWETYIGGGGWDQIEAIAEDNDENIILGGWTSSTDIPIIGGFSKNFNGGLSDGYIGKISKDGKYLIWSSYLGGSNFDYIFALDLDRSCNIVVAGATEDLTFPSGYDLTFNGLEDGFVCKISSDGENILWGSYIGGSLDEEVRSIKLDKEDNIFFGGWTISEDFPVPNGFDTTFNGGYWDAFILKLSPDGSNLNWGSYFGGNDNESSASIDFDLYGNILIAGTTYSSNLPFSNGFDTTFNGNNEGFIVKINDPDYLEGPPVADFKYFPPNPKEGEEIQFVDLSKKYPQNWLWDFGDGNNSNLQNPKHKYLAKGIYTVNLSVSNSYGSNSISKTVEVGEVEEKPFIQWLPVATNSPGANNSIWKTDLGIINKENSLMEIDFYLYTDNQTLKITDIIPPNGSFIYEDFLSLFSYNGSAPLEIKSNNEFILTSRIYNKEEKGTYGQFINGYKLNECLKEGEEGYLSQLTENSTFRTNIGFANIGERDANISIYYYNSNGSLIGTENINLKPKKFLQLLQPLKDLNGISNIDSAYSKIKINLGDCIIVYASVIDNRTNDGTTIPIKK